MPTKQFIEVKAKKIIQKKLKLHVTSSQITCTQTPYLVATLLLNQSKSVIVPENARKRKKLHSRLQ